MMRFNTLHRVWAVMATLPVAFIASGCSAEFCDIVECTSGSGGAGGGGTGASGPGGGTTSSGGGGGGGGGPAAECIPTNLTGPLPSECEGVFVKAGGIGNGTLADPYGSVADAVANVPSGGTIYVCYDAALRLNESVTIAKSVTILGQLDCDTATKAAGPSKLGGTGTAPSLKIQGSVNVHLADLDVTSPDLSTIAMPNGESSVAVWANQATVTIERSVLTAGKGAPGKSETEVSNTAQAPGGMAGGNGCLGVAMSSGGPFGSNTCVGEVVDGGTGGPGNNGPNGFDGDSGTWTGDGVCGAIPNCGMGGKKETTTAPKACAQGVEGGVGADGPPAAGAMTTDEGTLSAAGFVGDGGSNGVQGRPGGGGGGGGGANTCTTGMLGAGPGGGGGGAGGCGGLGGKGGGGGGGSFAVVAVGATLTVLDSTLATSAGGTGGSGAAGQVGTLGGPGGSAGGGDTDACKGGAGGDGGRGGAGGGGRGGPSVAIAYTGDMPIEMGNTFTLAATAAPGGAGGSGDAMGIGAAGLLEEMHAF